MKNTKILIAAASILLIASAASAQTTIPAGDDTATEIALPFSFPFCGESYGTAWVNSNGSISFGEGDTDFTESSSEMLTGPPRVAGFWDDLSPNNGGSVYYTTGGNGITVTWDSVPEFSNTGSNTFSITLKGSGQVELDYGNLTATDGLAGLSCGGAHTTNTEGSTDISALGGGNYSLRNEASLYELWASGTFDLGNSSHSFNAPNAFSDNLEPNDSIGQSRHVSLPFNSGDTYTALNSNSANLSFTDADWFEINGSSGELLVAEVTAAGGGIIIDPFFGPTFAPLDTLMAVFDNDGGLVAFDDDGGDGLLSKISVNLPGDGKFHVAVAQFGDTDFNGIQDTGSSSSFGARYILDMKIQSPFDEIVLDVGDDTATEVSFLCGGGFPYQGSTWGSVFVNSNGNLTFGVGDTDFTESVAEFLAEAPRIAPLWDDLAPNNQGEVTAQQTLDSMTIRYKNVPEWSLTGSNTFTVDMTCSTGDVSITYGATNGSDALVGVTEGGGAANPGSTDLSAGGPYSATGTTYEQFFAGFDLDGTTVDFIP